MSNNKKFFYCYYICKKSLIEKIYFSLQILKKNFTSKFEFIQIIQVFFFIKERINFLNIFFLFAYYFINLFLV